MDRDVVIGAIALVSFIGMIIAICLYIFPWTCVEVDTKTLIDYKPRGFMSPSVAYFDDGTVYEGIEFEGEICINARYKIIQEINIYGHTIGYKAVRVK